LRNVLATDHSFLHIDFDGNQPWESNGFPAEWDKDPSQVDFSLVATEVTKRMVNRQRAAAVLSFATIHRFTAQQLESAEALGITPIILWGTEDQCIAARPPCNQQLGDLCVHALEMRQRMEDRRLTADAVCVDLGAGIHVRSAVKKNPARIHETVFGGDVKWT
jgi:hypothetical protein